MPPPFDLTTYEGMTAQAQQFMDDAAAIEGAMDPNDPVLGPMQAQRVAKLRDAALTLLARADQFSQTTLRARQAEQQARQAEQQMSAAARESDLRAQGLQQKIAAAESTGQIAAARLGLSGQQLALATQKAEETASERRQGLFQQALQAAMSAERGLIGITPPPGMDYFPGTAALGEVFRQAKLPFNPEDYRFRPVQPTAFNLALENLQQGQMRR